MAETHIPCHVLALAEQAKGEVLDFHEYDDGRIVIVFVDGRKLSFEKVDEIEVPAETETPPEVGSDAPLPPKPQAAKTKSKRKEK